jgi:hypothetical protein
MKPTHEKKNTRPYWSKGFNIGIDLAFRVLGLTSGEAKRVLIRLIAMLRNSMYS